VNGNRSKEESSIRLFEKLVMADRKMLAGYWNSTVIPALVYIGILPEGSVFSWQQEEDVEKLWAMDEQLEPAGSTRAIHDMVRAVVHNQQMVLVHTTPGAATVVARLLDRNANPEILGAVAGNDVVLIAPRHISRTRQAHAAVVRTLENAR
jgi:hypothetical protein